MRKWKVHKLLATINGVKFAITRCPWNQCPWNLQWHDKLGLRNEDFGRLINAKERAERASNKPLAKAV